MTAILGISAYFHDAAAALVVNGEIVAAAQEERFTRTRHDPDFPMHAIEFCLQQGNLEIEQIDHVVFYEKPFLKFERLLETYLSFAPRGYRSFLTTMPVWLRSKLYLSRIIGQQLGNRYKKRILFLEHHESHAASAFFPSPFEDAAILTVDGVGEWATSTLGFGSGNQIQLKQQMSFPHSLGLLYSAFAVFCGFRVNSGEAKLMGLAPYGEPRFFELILESLVNLCDDGSFRLDLSYFDFPHRLRMTSKKFAKLFGGEARQPESELTQRECDMAASIQAVTEEILLRMTGWLHSQTATANLCLAGGVALNCVANGRLRRESPFSNIWVQPAAGDAGGALGAALFCWHQLLDKPRPLIQEDSMQGALLGPEFSRADYLNALQNSGWDHQEFVSQTELLQHVARQLSEGKIVGWFQGRMEFGPRALGNRSILADPRRHEIWSQLNQKIKFRESFRPFGPAILRETASQYFDVPETVESPYMLFADRIKPELRTNASGNPGLAQRNIPRGPVPAVTHVDYSSRLQTVDAGRNRLFYELLKAFEQQTGCPMLVNTSFNIRGEPIVASPADAIECFLKTELDILVLGSFVLTKSKVL